ncbi:MAG: bifunctional DNA-formamidopyrimidine glycosylase/DNA-(apurinic or apyrimidinic site) lyase [Limnobacter sp.]|nr:bifunctional DNA-formamidopyrimidine glycosylase/DNA-(apurinic or apyrimidinic site) lyase [Limnobacter sp.]
MPELPEVEITKRGVDAKFKGHTLRELTVRQPKLRWPVPQTVQACVGLPLVALARRSKYLLMDFGQHVLVVHLGMSGSLKIVSPQQPWDKHDHIQWLFDSDGSTGALRLNDPRRFGSVEYFEKRIETPADPYAHFGRFAALGPEPFSEAFQPESFYQSLRGRKLNIKTLLLSGKAVVGVGNIYACEALFRSQISPGRSASRVSRAQASLLYTSIVDVLSEAIERGGSTLRNFQAIDGELGHFQLHCDVYGRAGEKCKRCEGTIKRRVMGQRGTFYCPVCQK